MRATSSCRLIYIMLVCQTRSHHLRTCYGGASERFSTNPHARSGTSRLGMCGSHEKGGKALRKMGRGHDPSQSSTCPHSSHRQCHEGNCFRADASISCSVQPERNHLLANAVQPAEPLKVSPETQDHFVPRAHECPGNRNTSAPKTNHQGASGDFFRAASKPAKQN